jgi:hypothetical protein
MSEPRDHHSRSSLRGALFYLAACLLLVVILPLLLMAAGFGVWSYLKMIR